MKEKTNGFVKMVDKTPVIQFVNRFEKRLMEAATEKYGAIVPNDPRKLYELAREVLETFNEKPQ